MLTVAMKPVAAIALLAASCAERRPAFSQDLKPPASSYRKVYQFDDVSLSLQHDQVIVSDPNNILFSYMPRDESGPLCKQPLVIRLNSAQGPLDFRYGAFELYGVATRDAIENDIGVPAVRKLTPANKEQRWMAGTGDGRLRINYYRFKRDDLVDPMERPIKFDCEEHPRGRCFIIFFLTKGSSAHFSVDYYGPDGEKPDYTGSGCGRGERDTVGKIDKIVLSVLAELRSSIVPKK